MKRLIVLLLLLACSRVDADWWTQASVSAIVDVNCAGCVGTTDIANNAVDATKLDLTKNYAFTGTNSSPTVNSTTNCLDSAGDAACTAAPAGSVVVDAADTTTVVSTTAVTANSQIFLQVDSSLGTRLGITCNTQDPGTFDARVTARTAATSFTITLDTGPTTNKLCLSYLIVN